jgi:LmbE family N-acetylglucosaminyl deacetylase
MVCAGTLRRLVEQGVEVHVVAFSPAATVRDRRGTRWDVVLPEWNEALDIIGVAEGNRDFVGMTPTTNLPGRGEEICQYIFDFCERWQLDVAFILSPEDENTEHAVVGREAERVMRGRVPTVVRCNFPWNYSTGRPNLYVTLSEEDLEVKRRVICTYKSQQFRYNYEDMLLAYARGDGLSIKSQHAEKFEIIRSLT